MWGRMVSCGGLVIRLHLCVFIALASARAALDTRTVVSPNGELELRLFVDEPEPGDLYRIGCWLTGSVMVGVAILGSLFAGRETAKHGSLATTVA